MNNDIALLLLDRPVTKATVKLPTSPDQLARRAPVGARMLSIGFGSECPCIAGTEFAKT